MRLAYADAESPRCGMIGWRAFVKRVIDVVIAATALLVLFPFMFLVAIVIRVDSPGPAFFMQARVGKNGRKFNLYKFRSMCQDAEQNRSSVMHLNEAKGPIFKSKCDPRITRVGKILRRTSIDELPQLINVLKGDMSLVGPRPPLPCEVEQYSERAMRRLSVISGITCLWQINGRSNIPFDEWVELDIQYIENQSLWLDMKILICTIPAVLSGKGAR